jgi:hypothetical protein
MFVSLAGCGISDSRRSSVSSSFTIRLTSLMPESSVSAKESLILPSARA